MDAIEAVAEAICKNAGRVDWGGVRPEDAARAAVAALAAQGDITDEQLAQACERGDKTWWDTASPGKPTRSKYDHMADELRPILARQAAVHATREAELVEENERLELGVAQWERNEQIAHARAEAAEAEAAARLDEIAGCHAHAATLVDKIAALSATVERVTELAEATGMDPRVFVHAGMRAVIQSSIRAALADPKGDA